LIKVRKKIKLTGEIEVLEEKQNINETKSEDHTDEEKQVPLTDKTSEREEGGDLVDGKSQEMVTGSEDGIDVQESESENKNMSQEELILPIVKREVACTLELQLANDM
jgi:hypothetical protein